jgi:DDE superfamily endonuclease
MTRRLPVEPAPAPLEGYAARFDDLFGARAQRDGFRRYLEGLLLPAERNKTLTALANTEPVAGAQRREAQSLQWFVSESGWDPEEINERRLELLFGEPTTSASEKGVLIIDEHGDRKWGKHTAHVGRQWLANIGKTDNGVVSVSSLWADEEVYYPVDFEPYTPAHHFDAGKNDPEFRTKLKIARQLVECSVAMGVPFRAVVADSFYGEDRGFKHSLGELGVGYILSLKKSHCWWHVEGTIGALWEAALGAGWEGAEEPGGWTKVMRTFREGHREEWWALEVEAGPYGRTLRHGASKKGARGHHRPRRAAQSRHLVPDHQPARPRLRAGNQRRSSWPGGCRGGGENLRIEDVGGAELQAGQARVRLERIPSQERHSHKTPLAVGVLRIFVLLVGLRALADRRVDGTGERSFRRVGGRGEKEDPEILAGDAQGGKGVAGTVGNAVALLESVLRDAPTVGAKSAA